MSLEADALPLSQDWEKVLTEESGVPDFVLPSLLAGGDGHKVRSPEQWWRARRPELLDHFSREVFGHFPVQPLQSTLARKQEDVFMGSATRVQTVLRLTHAASGKVIRATVLLYVPKTKTGERVPVFLGLNLLGNHTLTEDKGVALPSGWVPGDEGHDGSGHSAREEDRGACEDRWPVRELLGHGFGVATAYCGDFEPDHSGGRKEGIRDLFDAVAASKGSGEFEGISERRRWGRIGAWSYGLMRIMDYLEQETHVDPHRVALIGHSRLAKAALWAAANDPRFALVIANGSGCTGAALSRRRFGETIRHINTRYPDWFCKKYHSYNEREDSLPVDQHMLLSLVAPRPLYVAGASEDLWADPRGEYLGLVHAAPAWEMLGAKQIALGDFPQPNGRAWSGPLGYHLRDGGHDITHWDWRQFLAFAREWLG